MERLIENIYDAIEDDQIARREAEAYETLRERMANRGCRVTEIEIGRHVLQPNRQLLLDGEHVHLGPRALQILSILAEADGEIVTKDELMHAVWGNVIVEENALQVHVASLRKALEDDADRLKTLRGIGYQLDTAIPLLAGSKGSSEVASQTGEPSEITVVLIPFVNLSQDPEQAYFADGVSEDIITDLGKVAALKVIAAPKREDSRHDAQAVGSRFNATHVLEGSVRKSGNRLRVTAQLVKAANGEQVWGERYDRNLSDIFELQDELSREIVGALQLKLLPDESREIADRGTREPDAYDAFLRARALRATMDLECIRKAPSAYREAIRLDPRFAKAWAGLSTSLMQVKSHFGNSSETSLHDIEKAVARAESLAPDLPDVVASKAQICCFRHDWEGVDKCLKKFRETGISDWSIFSHILLIRGYPNEAVAHQEKVRNSEPLSPGANWALQYHLACDRQFEEAEIEFRRSTQMLGPMAPLLWEAAKRAVAMGDLEIARDRIQEFHHRYPDLRRGGGIDPRGDRETAVKELRLNMADPSVEDQIYIASLGHMAMLFDEPELALKALRQAVLKARGLLLMDIWHPINSPLRHSEEFKSILLDVGLVDHCRRTKEWGNFLRPKGNTDFQVIAES